VAEGVASATWLVAGRASDRFARRPLCQGRVRAGRAGKVVIASAVAWPVVLVGRGVDRLGKGVPLGARDALLVDCIPSAFIGRPTPPGCRSRVADRGMGGLPRPCQCGHRLPPRGKVLAGGGSSRRLQPGHLPRCAAALAGEVARAVGGPRDRRLQRRLRGASTRGPSAALCSSSGYGPAWPGATPDECRPAGVGGPRHVHRRRAAHPRPPPRPIRT
jgi:hypothetical protein